MDFFVRKHQKKINGTLGCFDRMLFRGYLPIQSGWAMAQFLNQNQISFRRLKDFLTDNANKINQHAKTMAAKLHRPFQYLTVPTRKEDLARKMAEDEGIKRRLVCIFSVLESCRTFSFSLKKAPALWQAKRNGPTGNLFDTAGSERRSGFISVFSFRSDDQGEDSRIMPSGQACGASVDTVLTATAS
jgi:hypothetical protein